MLNLWGNRLNANCERTNRRDFLKIGTLAMSGLTLSSMLRLKSVGAAPRSSANDVSVIWLWLGGGPTHIETFDPKMTAPAEFRSAVGALKTSVPGIEIGGLLPQMAKQAHRMAFLRSFAHGNSGHSGGTHYVMTGVDHPPADNGQPQIKPFVGSMVSRIRGANNPQTGIPTYIRLSGLYADGPHWLGPAYSPFDIGGQARNNLNLTMPLDRLANRRQLLNSFDTVNRKIDQSRLMDGLDSFDQQAFDLIMGRAKEAMDLNREDPRVVDHYKNQTANLGTNLLLARRLCEAGCGFVTLHYANSYQSWDMHEKIVPQLQTACPPMDRAISVFLEDLADRGLSEKILLVITGEFGRTPRINGVAGRDHWGPLCTMALAGGGLKMGQVIGESTEKAEVPKSAPITPKDVMATIFHALGIDLNTQLIDPTGRPTNLLPEGAKPIAQLV